VVLVGYQAVEINRALTGRLPYHRHRPASNHDGFPP
jgi:hypothetical protein